MEFYNQSPFTVKFENKTKESFETHNKEYMAAGKLEIERATHEKFTRENLQEKQDIPLGRVLRKFNKIKIAVDVGSGTGWASKYMIERSNIEKVFALEPSQAAVDIAKVLCESVNDKVEWATGFAEEALSSLAIPTDQPVLFNTMCVLSHLDDETTKRICAAINEKAPIGSVISFSECWGTESHEPLWHVRTETWWKERFPGWNINFDGVQIQNVEGRFKGFYGQRIK